MGRSRSLLKQKKPKAEEVVEEEDCAEDDQRKKTAKTAKTKSNAFNVIRKISIGADYKNDAMHYSIGQQVYGGHIINNIDHNERDNSYNIFIKKER